MRTLLAAVLLGLLGGVCASPARASRAEVDGRGLPRLLAVDPTLARVLPASVGILDPQALFDYSTGDPFVMAVGGRAVRYAYFVDDDSHNLLVAFPSGWGFTAGYSEVYSESEFHNLIILSSGYASEEFSKTQNERRELRLGLGWRHPGASGRVLEIGLGASYLDWDNTTHNLYLSEDGPEYETKGGWDSDRALGFDVTVRSVSPSPGVQVALHLSYANLKPKSDVPLSVGAHRRRASVDVGWRLATPETDDLVMGFTASWQTDTDLRLTARDVYELTANQEETKVGTLGVFLSGEREILRDLRVRGGVRGLISFRDVEDKNQAVRDSYEGEYRMDTFDASIDSPDFFLGAGYRWRDLTFEARVRENVNLDAPIVRWSVGMAF